MIDLLARERAFLDTFLPIGDLRERLDAITEFGIEACANFKAEDRNEQNLIPGCVTRVWLVSVELSKDRCQFHCDSESQILKGITGLHLHYYNEASPAQVIEFPPLFIEKLGLNNILSPTRQRGLKAFYQRLCKIAAEALEE